MRWLLAAAGFARAGGDRPAGRFAGRLAGASAAALVLFVLVAVCLLTRFAGAGSVRWVDDLGELAFAGAASLATGLARLPKITGTRAVLRS